MMRKKISPTKTLIALVLLLAGCVSLSLPKTTDTKSTDAAFTPPQNPFIEISQDHLDRAWRNPKNGNTISYYSECPEDGGPSLENIQRGLVQSVNGGRILARDRIKISGEDALKAVVQGTFEGVASRIEMVLFKKENCNYILTYIGVVDHFKTNHPAFEAFVKSFEVRK